MIFPLLIMFLFFIRGSTPELATEDIINVQLPKLQELMSINELSVDNIDVFCEKGVFDIDHTRRILEAGKRLGLAINFHGDELHPMKAAEVFNDIFSILFISEITELLATSANYYSSKL